MHKRFLSILSTTFLICLLLACADNSSSPPPGASTGTFSDAGLVSGLQYSTATQTGITNSKGQFYYMPGETVTFSVGGIVLGQATAAASLNTFNLVGISPPLTGLGIPNKTTASNSFQQAANISIFLQTIDSDGNPLNGIAVTSQVNELAAKTSLNFKQSSDNFQTYFAFRKFIGSCRAAGLWGGSKQIIVTSYALANLYLGLSVNPTLYGESSRTMVSGGTVVTNTTYDAYGNTIKTESFDGNGIATGSTAATFDVNGNRTKSQAFDANGNSTGYQTFSYDSNGNNTEFAYYDGLNLLIGKVLYFYDINGSMVNKQNYNSSSTLTSYINYSYDSFGSLVKSETFNAGGVLQSYIAYTYDANNNVTSTKPYSANGSLSGSYSNFTYDGNNYLSKTENYNSSNVLIASTLYTYDTFGNKTSETSYDGSGALVLRQAYSYDSNGYLSTFQSYNASNTLTGTAEKTYNSNGNITSWTSTYMGTTSTTNYTYGSATKGWGVIFLRYQGNG